jgi:hypothetical protein
LLELQFGLFTQSIFKIPEMTIGALPKTSPTPQVSWWLIPKTGNTGVCGRVKRTARSCCPMNNDRDGRNRRRTDRTLVIFAVAAVLAGVVALLTTIHGVDSRRSSNGAAPGTTGLAHPHPPLDRSPGEPLK